MNEIKQQKIKLNEDERNSENNKNKNDELNNILSVINKIYQVSEYKFFLNEQSDESNLPKWVKVSKQRFDLIKKEVQNAKINNLQAKPKGAKVVNFSESNKLFYDIENSKNTYEEALERVEYIRSDINKIISMQSLNTNQINVLNTIFMVNKFFTRESASVWVNKENNFEVLKKNQT